MYIGNFNKKLKENKYYFLNKWSSNGVLSENKKELPMVKIKARLIIPKNYRDYGYLVYKNFDSLLNWNRSNYFAIAVGKLSDSIHEN